MTGYKIIKQTNSFSLYQWWTNWETNQSYQSVNKCLKIAPQNKSKQVYWVLKMSHIMFRFENLVHCWCILWEDHQVWAFWMKYVTGLGFKVSRTSTVSSALILPPVCGLRCEISGVTPMPCCLPGAMLVVMVIIDSYHSGIISSKQSILSIRCLVHGVLSQQ